MSIARKCVSMRGTIINREFDSSLLRSRVIVTDITKLRFEIYTIWDLVTQLSRELFEVDQICQLLECAHR